MKIGFILAIILVPSAAQAQLQLDAGQGNFFQGPAAGVGAHLYRGNVVDYAGLEYVNGRVIPSASTEFKFHGTDLTLGSQTLSMSEDFAGVSVPCVCVSARKDLESTSVTLFAGATGPSYYLFNSSYGIIPNRPGYGVLLRHQFRYHPQHIPPAPAGYRLPSIGEKLLTEGRLEFSSLDVRSGQFSTASQSISYSFRQNFRAAISGGEVNNQRFWAGSASAYAKHFGVYGSHEQFFFPFQAVAEGIGTSYSRSFFNVSAGSNQSRSLGYQVQGYNATAGVRFSWISETTGWYRADRQTLWSHLISENFKQRYTVTESITQSNGQTAFNVGGAVNFNRFQASYSHSIQFVIGRGYISVQNFSFSLRIHDSQISATTVTDPFGHMLYFVNQTSYFQVGAGGLPGQIHSRSIGKFVLSGRCIEPDGTPVDGCTLTLRIRKKNFYVVSNSAGRWELSEKHPDDAELFVKVDEFAAAGQWQTETPELRVIPGEPITVTVQRQ
jgi:hypothetical protein